MVRPMLTATAACRRAASIKVRIAINNSRGSWLIRSRSRCVILTLLLCSLDPRTHESWNKGYRWFGGEPPRFLGESVSQQLCSRLLHNCREVIKEFWTAPPRVQSGAPLGKSLSHLCRKYRRLGRFCRLCRFVSPLPSIFCVGTHSMRREATIDLILAGSDLFSATYTLPTILLGSLSCRPL